MMPPGGGEIRAEQLATLEQVRHEKLASDAIARLLDQLSSYEEELPYDSDGASLIRVARREHEKARRVPAELKGAIARAGSLGGKAWRAARERSDYSLLAPHLERIVELKLRYAACFDAADVYDPLLDDYEPGMTTAAMAGLLEELKAGLVPLVGRITERAGTVDDSFLHGHFPIDAQQQLVAEILRALPHEAGAWRLDMAAHPFATAVATTDVRITTRYFVDLLPPGIFAMLHEYGHGLYENGVSRSLERTPLCVPTSLGIHESQSRMWENLVGRSRPFWSCFFPRVAAAFPEQLTGVDAERFYRAVNRVQPSLIRVEADQATYDLHVILRFELEQQILHERLAVSDLPEAWNARIKAYLGLDVPDDSLGVLQDVHWSEGDFGYFPTYSLGNIVSAQIWEAARSALGDLDGQIEQGDFAPLAGWLREHVHVHGCKFMPAETLERAIGSRAEVGPYLRYLQVKFAELYGLS
jgi:carboxypeptidase Taq